MANTVCECPRARKGAAARADALCCMPGALAWPHAGRRRRLESPCKVRFCRVTNCTERICAAPVAAQTSLFAMGRMPDMNTLAEEWVRPHGVSTCGHMCCIGSGTMDRQEMPAEPRQGSNAGPFKMCTEAKCAV